MRTIKNLLVGLGLLLLAIAYDFHLRRSEMTRETKKVWKWWLIAVLTIAVLRLLTGCVRPVTEPRIILYPYRLITLDELPEGAYGMTGCDTILNQPVVAIRTDVANSPEFVTVLAHEAEHVRQMGYYGAGKNCTNFMALYHDDPAFRLASELVAYCRGALMGVKVLHWKYTEALASYVESIHRTRALPGQTQKDIADLLAHTCLEVQNADQREAPS